MLGKDQNTLDDQLFPLTPTEKKSMSQEVMGFANTVRERFVSHEYLYEAFLHEWNLYKEGHKGKHDLYCEIVALFCDHQDFVEELKRFFRDSTVNPLSKQMDGTAAVYFDFKKA